MNQVKRKKRKAHVEERDCVACGCCVKVCPMSAIQIFHGVMAVGIRKNALAAESV